MLLARGYVRFRAETAALEEAWVVSFLAEGKGRRERERKRRSAVGYPEIRS